MAKTYTPMNILDANTEEIPPLRGLVPMWVNSFYKDWAATLPDGYERNFPAKIKMGQLRCGLARAGINWNMQIINKLRKG